MEAATIIGPAKFWSIAGLVVALFGGPYRKRDKEMARWKWMAAAAMIAAMAFSRSLRLA